MINWENDKQFQIDNENINYTVNKTKTIYMDR